MAARSLIAAALLGVAGHASAVYVELEPPVGWFPKEEGQEYASLKIWPSSAKIPGATPSKYIGVQVVTPRPVLAKGQPYNDPVLNWLYDISPGSTAHAFVPAAVYGAGAMVNASLNVAGRRILVPAFLKYAPTAAREAAKQGFRGHARSLWATMLVAAGLTWLWDEINENWYAPGFDQGTLYGGAIPSQVWFRTVPEFCGAATSYRRSQFPNETVVFKGYKHASNGQVQYCHIVRTNSAGNDVDISHLIGRYECKPVDPNPLCTPSQPRVIPEEEWIEEVEPLPWPDELPEQLPFPLPVFDPKINPLPSPWDEPQPFRTPIGEPVPNPDYDPTKEPSTENPPQTQPTRWIIPVADPKTPWEVDTKPTDEPLPDGTPEPNPETDPTVGPGGSPGPGQGGPQGQEKTPLLCEVFPNISACQPLGQAPEAQKPENRDINVSITPDGGWGPDSAACPADRTFGKGWNFSFSMICDFASGIRPLVIAFAWLSAALMVVGVARKQ